MTDITSQTTDLLQAIFSVVTLVVLVMVITNKLAHMIRKNMVE